MTQNYFARQGKGYLKSRPAYPETLFNYLASACSNHHLAWDCATGNGQFAAGLSPCFENIYATDIHPDPLKHAIQKPNISYHAVSAEDVSLPENSVDLITAAQAIHWFNQAEFYETVRRVAKPGAIIAVIGFREAEVSSEIDALQDYLFQDILGNFWTGGKALFDGKFSGLEFPFDVIETPSFQIELQWNVHQLLQLWNSYSASQKYQDKYGELPTAIIHHELLNVWGRDKEEVKSVRFPLLMRVGNI